MKNLKTLAAALILAGAFSSAPAFASHCVTCPPDDWTNGPSLDGFVESHLPGRLDLQLPGTDPVSIPNGPGGVAQPQSIKTCTKNSAECSDPNGPSLDGFVDGDQIVLKTVAKRPQ
jgi:hypothetical protein